MKAVTSQGYKFMQKKKGKDIYMFKILLKRFKREAKVEPQEPVRQIYTDWAFGGDSECAKMNRSIYEELRGKYKIYKGCKQNLVDKVDVDFDEFDIVIESYLGNGYSEYTIRKNAPNLTMDELALICDRGNLCFGYTEKETCIHVFQD